MRTVVINREADTLDFVFDGRTTFKEIMHAQTRLRETRGLIGARANGADGVKRVRAELEHEEDVAVSDEDLMSVVQVSAGEIMMVIGAVTRFVVGPDLPQELHRLLNQWNDDRETAASRHEKRHGVTPREARTAFESRLDHLVP